jgi:hypothetical protein
MHSAIALRRELSVRGQQIAAATGSVHELTPGEMPSVIFGRDENRRHGNFHPPLTGISAQIRSGRGAQGPYSLAQALSSDRTAMDGTRLCQQLGRAPYEHILLPAHSGEPCRGIIGDARLRPLFERGDECFLARSSARPKSRVRRVRPAMTRADSMRRTASMVRWKT